MPRSITIPLDQAEQLAALAGAGMPVCTPAPAALSALRLEIAKARRVELAGLVARRQIAPLESFLRHASDDAIQEAIDIEIDRAVA